MAILPTNKPSVNVGNVSGKPCVNVGNVVGKPSVNDGNVADKPFVNVGNIADKPCQCCQWTATYLLPLATTIKAEPGLTRLDNDNLVCAVLCRNGSS